MGAALLEMGAVKGVTPGGRAGARRRGIYRWRLPRPF